MYYELTFLLEVSPFSSDSNQFHHYLAYVFLSDPDNKETLLEAILSYYECSSYNKVLLHVIHGVAAVVHWAFVSVICMAQ